MTRRRNIAALALGTSALLALTACSSSQSTGAEEPASSGAELKGTLQFVSTQIPEKMEPVIAAFEDANPGVSVEYSQVPFDKYNPVLQQRLGAGDDTIDVYAVEQVNAAQYAAQGYLTDLSDLSAQTEEVVSKSVFDSLNYDGKLYALPMLSSTQVLLYNKGLLDTAGIEHPSADPAERLTWQQITEDAQAAQAAGAKYGLMFNQPEAYYQLEPVIESAGGDAGIGGEDNLEVDITGAEWEDTLSWYGDLYESGLAPRGIGGFETGPLFLNGELAYYVTGTWNVKATPDSAVDWGVAPMPQWEGGDAVTPVIGWVLGENPKSDVPDLARAFMEFVSLNTDGATALGTGTGEIPGNLTAIAASMQHVEEAAGEHAAGVAKIVEYELNNTASAPPASVGFPQFQENVNLALADIRNGLSVKDALAKAQEAIESAWKRLE